jgi:hypothetical protein
MRNFFAASSRFPTDELRERPDATEVPAPEDQGDLLIGRGYSMYNDDNELSVGRETPDVGRELER